MLANMVIGMAVGMAIGMAVGMVAENGMETIGLGVYLVAFLAGYWAGSYFLRLW